MKPTRQTYRGGRIFDGRTWRDKQCLVLEDGQIVRWAPVGSVTDTGEIIDLEGDILCPGFFDLQVNGGGGIMFNDDPSVETLMRIVTAHRRLGTAAILPTLITDTPEKTRAAIEAVKQATALAMDGIAGLHLEGPHLSVARKGAHDASLIRPMTDADLEVLLKAARDLPALMITIAPENVTKAQVAALARAGAVLSLGHSDTDYQTSMDYAEAGARCVTHLFNAMSQMGSRAPGLAGAALANGDLSAGLIADGIHVHPATMRNAFRAKASPGSIFLISDAMAPVGSDITHFQLGGRSVHRTNGRLTLDDGTLAGADLTMTQAIRVLVREVGIDLATALAAATSVPASVMKWPAPAGHFMAGERPFLVRLNPDLELVETYPGHTPIDK